LRDYANKKTPVKTTVFTTTIRLQFDCATRFDGCSMACHSSIVP